MVQATPGERRRPLRLTIVAGWLEAWDNIGRSRRLSQAEGPRQKQMGTERSAAPSTPAPFAYPRQME